MCLFSYLCVWGVGVLDFVYLVLWFNWCQVNSVVYDGVLCVCDCSCIVNSLFG